MELPELGQLLKTAKIEMIPGASGDVFIYDMESRIDDKSIYPSAVAISATDVPGLLNKLKQMKARPPTAVCLAVIEEIDTALSESSLHHHDAKAPSLPSRSGGVLAFPRAAA